MNIELLSIPLPEDNLKFKYNRNFKLMKTVINERLQRDVPEIFKERLRLELEIIDSFKKEFIYTKEEAIRILNENISNFQIEEFDQLLIEGALEFIFIEAQLMIKDDFLENLIKTRTKYAKRYKKENHSVYQKLDPNLVEKQQPDFYLEEVKPHYIFSDYLVNVTNEVIQGETNPLLKAKNL